MNEKIYNKKKLYALIIRNKYKKKGGINFFTDKKATQHVGFMKHKKYYIILPHKHNKRKKKCYCKNRQYNRSINYSARNFKGRLLRSKRKIFI